MNKITQILQSVAMMAVVVLAGACANHDDIDNVEARIERASPFKKKTLLRTENLHAPHCLHHNKLIWVMV